MSDVAISVLDNGPVIVKGDFSLTDGAGQPYPKLSNNLPIGAHLVD
jgi:hypothetical protein